MGLLHRSGDEDIPRSQLAERLVYHTKESKQPSFFLHSGILKGRFTFIKKIWFQYPEISSDEWNSIFLNLQKSRQFILQGFLKFLEVS